MAGSKGLWPYRLSPSMHQVLHADAKRQVGIITMEKHPMNKLFAAWALASLFGAASIPAIAGANSPPVGAPTTPNMGATPSQMGADPRTQGNDPARQGADTGTNTGIRSGTMNNGTGSPDMSNGTGSGSSGKGGSIGSGANALPGGTSTSGGAGG